MVYRWQPPDNGAGPLTLAPGLCRRHERQIENLPKIVTAPRCWQADGPPDMNMQSEGYSYSNNIWFLQLFTWNTWKQQRHAPSDTSSKILARTLVRLDMHQAIQQWSYLPLMQSLVLAKQPTWIVTESQKLQVWQGVKDIWDGSL